MINHVTHTVSTDYGSPPKVMVLWYFINGTNKTAVGLPQFVVEPFLLPLNGETIAPASAICSGQAHVDVCASYWVLGWTSECIF